MKIEGVQNNGTNNCYGAKIFKVKYHSLSILNVETPLIDLIKNYLTGNFYFLRSLPLSIFKSLSDCSGESTVLFS